MFTASCVTGDFQSGRLHPANSQRPAARPQRSAVDALLIVRVTSRIPSIFGEEPAFRALPDGFEGDCVMQRVPKDAENVVRYGEHIRSPPMRQR